MELIVYPGADAPHVYVHASTLCCFHSLIRNETFRRALTVWVDRCAEIKSARSVAVTSFAESGGRCRKARLQCVDQPPAPGQAR